MKLHSINTAQRLYVMPCGQGFSCYGFDVLDRKARAVAEWLENQPEITHNGTNWARAFLKATGSNGAGLPVVPGTAQHFTLCAAVMDQAAAFAATHPGKRCNAELCPALIGLEGQRVEVTYPDGQRARFYVGKSCGWMPCHLEIKTRRSLGGGTACVPEGSTVRVVTTKGGR
jgi:hypothetical protein